MESEKSETKLSHLPTDVLDLIFQGPLHSFLVLDLIKCGDLLLNQKLFHGITCIDLKDGRQRTKSRYPKLLSSFPNLRELSIDRGNWLLMSTCVESSRQIELLASSKLKILRIDCESVNRCLWRYDASSNVVISKHDNGKSAMLPLSTLFPSLESLHVAPQHPWALTFEDFPSLPSTLTDLCLREIVISKPYIPFMAMLPRSLQTLRVPLLFNNIGSHPLSHATFWHNPPPQLREISSIICRQSSRLDGPIRLPQTLEKCDLSPHIFLYDLADILRQLPPKFKILPSLRFQDIPTFDSQPAQHYSSLILPKGLTKLGIGVSRDDALRCCSLIPTLPDTIIELDIQCIPDQNDLWNALETAFQSFSGHRFWPPHMTSFARNRFSKSILTCIPKTIPSMEVSWPDHFITFDLFSPSLHSLNLDLKSPFLLFKVMSSNVSSLTYLKMDASYGIIKFDMDSLLHLPSTLKTLILDVIPDSNPSEGFALPPALTTLSVLAWKPEWIESLPPSLIVLKLLKFAMENVSAALSALMRLPIGLQELVMSSKSLTKSLDRLPFLPRLQHLVRLDLNEFGAMTEGVLQDLPLSLRELALPLHHQISPELRSFVNPLWRKMDIPALVKLKLGP